jgi:hypothetical protein
MSAMTNRFNSISEAEMEQLQNVQDKIELVNCPRKNMICQEQLSVVNKCYVESDQYFRDKDYDRSINVLREAFYKTAELNESPCAKCAHLFRSTIKDSMADIHQDLKKMTSGIFGKKSCIPSCVKAADVLKEFENINLQESFKKKDLKNRFIGNLVEKQVS